MSNLTDTLHTNNRASRSMAGIHNMPNLGTRVPIEPIVPAEDRSRSPIHMVGFETLGASDIYSIPDSMVRQERVLRRVANPVATWATEAVAIGVASAAAVGGGGVKGFLAGLYGTRWLTNAATGLFSANKTPSRLVADFYRGVRDVEENPLTAGLVMSQTLTQSLAPGMESPEDTFRFRHAAPTVGDERTLDVAQAYFGAGGRSFEGHPGRYYIGRMANDLPGIIAGGMFLTQAANVGLAKIVGSELTPKMAFGLKWFGFGTASGAINELNTYRDARAYGASIGEASLLYGTSVGINTLLNVGTGVGAAVLGGSIISNIVPKITSKIGVQKTLGLATVGATQFLDGGLQNAAMHWYQGAFTQDWAGDDQVTQQEVQDTMGLMSPVAAGVIGGVFASGLGATITGFSPSFRGATTTEGVIDSLSGYLRATGSPADNTANLKAASDPTVEEPLAVDPKAVTKTVEATSDKASPVDVDTLIDSAAPPDVSPERGVVSLAKSLEDRMEETLTKAFSARGFKKDPVGVLKKSVEDLILVDPANPSVKRTFPDMAESVVKRVGDSPDTVIRQWFDVHEAIDQYQRLLNYEPEKLLKRMLRNVDHLTESAYLNSWLIRRESPFRELINAKIAEAEVDPAKFRAFLTGTLPADEALDEATSTLMTRAKEGLITSLRDAVQETLNENNRFVKDLYLLMDMAGIDTRVFDNISGTLPKISSHPSLYVREAYDAIIKSNTKSLDLVNNLLQSLTSRDAVETATLFKGQVNFRNAFAFGKKRPITFNNTLEKGIITSKEDLSGHYSNYNQGKTHFLNIHAGSILDSAESIYEFFNKVRVNNPDTVYEIIPTIGQLSLPRLSITSDMADDASIDAFYRTLRAMSKIFGDETVDINSLEIDPNELGLLRARPPVSKKLIEIDGFRTTKVSEAEETLYYMTKNALQTPLGMPQTNKTELARMERLLNPELVNRWQSVRNTQMDFNKKRIGGRKAAWLHQHREAIKTGEVPEIVYDNTVPEGFEVGLDQYAKMIEPGTVMEERTLIKGGSKVVVPTHLPDAFKRTPMEVRSTFEFVSITDKLTEANAVKLLNDIEGCADEFIKRNYIAGPKINSLLHRWGTTPAELAEEFGIDLNTAEELYPHVKDLFEFWVNLKLQEITAF